MDNDLCQTSKKALTALRQIECEFHRIPARSPDVNHIEKIFHSVKIRLEKDAIDCNITQEPFESFKKRVLRILQTSDVSTIDRTIESMPKRIKGIINSQGVRIKY